MESFQVSEAYVLGLLTELEGRVPQLGAELQAAERRASAVTGELEQVVARCDACRQARVDAAAAQRRTTAEIGLRNQTLATLHQEVATFRRRVDALSGEMQVQGGGAALRHLRRERGRLRVEIQDREAIIGRLQGEILALRQALQAAGGDAQASRDRERAARRELDAMQDQLVRPSLTVDLFEAAVARAHCRFFLDRDPGAWAKDVGRGVGSMTDLHEALRRGTYRLDQHDELIGGRAVATGEAFFAAAALGAHAQAVALFELATHPRLLMHEIFHVFRLWCGGLYVTGRHEELRRLLRVHRYAEGLRGAYVEAFSGLLRADPRRVAKAVVDIARREWQIWQDPRHIRGLGVVNLAAAAIVGLAAQRGLRVAVAVPTVPVELVEAFLLARDPTPEAGKAKRLRGS